MASRYITAVDFSGTITYTETVNDDGTVTLTPNRTVTTEGTQINAELWNGIQSWWWELCE